jgi:hypothetical protein
MGEASQKSAFSTFGLVKQVLTDRAGEAYKDTDESVLPAGMVRGIDAATRQGGSDMTFRVTW